MRENPPPRTTVTLSTDAYTLLLLLSEGRSEADTLRTLVLLYYLSPVTGRPLVAPLAPRAPHDRVLLPFTDTRRPRLLPWVRSSGHKLTRLADACIRDPDAAAKLVAWRTTPLHDQFRIIDDALPTPPLAEV